MNADIRRAIIADVPPEWAHLFTSAEWRSLSASARRKALAHLATCRECVYRNEDAAYPHNACAGCKGHA